MKNYLKFTYLLCFSVLLFGCSENEEDIITEEIQQKDIKNILLDMKKVGDAEEKIVVFEMKNFDKKNYEQHFELIENSKKVIAFATGSSDFRKSPGDNYKVTCTYGNGETEVTECGEDPGCAGDATWKCLASGGCATICNAVITYTPSFNPGTAAKKSKPVQQIETILERVQTMGQAEKKSISFTISRNKDSYTLKETTFIHNNKNTNAKRIETFVVYCYDSEGELLWEEIHYDRQSASADILKCTDVDGGCAEVCEINAVYIYQ
ncbi:hypothetical protein KORDIASMS9_00011 [Kordia sp. SMS9]|uniref:hypothetical protein n=1 Tax=Kordia sp. SMS9 TaxID=2282170 RepID=UPI000E0CF3CE|nr:hypothetical protein [Kordia sp. SMS9]AXG67829.1 hypothetical protein KORDIASMS9_00011 [Kordia sp. SMS9]